MTGSVKHYVGIRNALGVVLMLASYLVCGAAAAAGQRSLEVIDLNSTSAADEASKARTAFAKGDAIVRMIGASPADFERLVGVRTGEIKAFSDKTQKPGAASRRQLKIQAVAAYVDGKGILRSLLSFAPDGDGWRKQMDEWVAREQSKAAGILQEGDSPEPPADAWTLLYTTTIQTSDSAGSAQSTNAVYRLNTTSNNPKSPPNEVYMVYTIPQTTPDFTKQLVQNPASNCDGISYCGWHTVERDFQISNGAAKLVDHGPTGTITESEAGFHVGLDVGPEGPGVSAGFSASWSTPSVTTTDKSNNQTGSWQETFSFGISANRCVPLLGTLPVVSSGTFLSRQAAIFEVPSGTVSISPAITQQSLFCSYIGGIWEGGQGSSYDWLTIQQSFPLGAPVLQALPTSLTVPSGGTAPLLVSAYIPGSDLGLPWEITSNQLWLTVPSKGPFTAGQVVPVTVASTTKDGTAGGTLSINTSPGFAAPSVATGPILVNVTVGKPTNSASLAGILLFGGVAPDGKTFFGAQFYDLVSKAVFPLAPQLPERFFSTATLLNTGNILIAGGTLGYVGASAGLTATAELFNPGSLTFSYTGTLTTARAEHTATLLPDGKVLIVGGIDANGSLASAELYDPSTGKFSSAGSLQTPRFDHYASLISSPDKPAQVVVYGGFNNTAPVLEWELWDEAQNRFIGNGTMLLSALAIPQPVLFADGVLDLVGGSDGTQFLKQEQLLTLNGPSFQLGDELQVPRAVHTLTALPDGAGLLVTGGFTSITDPTPAASAEIRDADGWHLLSGTATCPGNPGCMTAARAGHTATLLPDGTVFLVGGNTVGFEQSGPDTEFYDPTSKTFTSGPPIGARISHTATLVVTTATTLISTPPSSTFGQTVNLAASVTSAVGTPTGSVRFLDGSTELGSAELIQGQASINVATLSNGSHALKAVYAGDTISSPSESAVVTQVVGGSTTSTTLSLLPNPSQFGSVVTMTAIVDGTGGPVTGTVVFSDGGKQIASANLANGSATAQVSDLSIGQHPITATYSGNGNTQGSTSATVKQTVTAVKLGTTTTLSSNNNPSTSGQSVTFQAVVNPVSGTGVPTGTVNFLDGSTVVGTADLVSGTASFTSSILSKGTHQMVGEYLGDSNFSGSTSNVLPQAVSSPSGGKVTPTVDLTVNGNTNATVSAGDTVTFVARIHAAPNYPWPTGSVTISDSTNANNRYGSANLTKDPNSNDGLATIATSGIGAGSYTLVATYGGDNEGKYYNGAQSNSVSLTVKPRLGGPHPEPRLAISATAGERNGQLLLVSLTVSNNGTAPASGITLNQIVLRTLAGMGEAVPFAPTLPVTVGELPPGASTVVVLELQVPTTIRELALIENGTFQDGHLTVDQFRRRQVVWISASRHETDPGRD